MITWRAMGCCVILAFVWFAETPVQSQSVNPTQSAEQVFTAKEVSKRAVLTSKPQPETTRKSRYNNTEGKVRLRAVLSSSGEVKDITVLQGLPDGLTENAIESARKIKFTPAEKDGRPVSMSITLEYSFVIYYNAKQTERKAEILSLPATEYTEEARRNRVSGTVTLEIGLTSFGEVEVLRVIQGLPHGLTEKAIQAARQVKFKPAMFGRRPVSQTYILTYTFSLAEPPPKSDRRVTLPPLPLLRTVRATFTAHGSSFYFVDVEPTLK